MRNLSALLKVQFLSFFGINRIANSKRKGKIGGFAGLIFVALLLGALIALTGYFYAQTFGESLLAFGKLSELLPLMLAVSSLVCLVFSFYAASGALYGFKDYDMLSAMPVKTGTVIFSKLLFMYISDLIFTVLLIIPSAVVYCEAGGYLGIGSALRLFLMTVFSPLLPLSVSIIVGACVCLVSARFKRKNVVQIILYFILFGGVFAISFCSGYTGDVTKIFYVLYPIIPWVIAGTDSFAFALLTAAVSAVSATAVTAVAAVTYKRMNAIITATCTAKNFRLKNNYGRKGIFKALFGKEIKTLFGYAVYAMNSLTGVILGIVASVAVAILFNAVAELEAVKEVVLLFSPLMFSFMFMLSSTTACAISMEGSSFWIIKSSPISVKTLVNAKLAVNAVFNVIPAFACSVLIAIGLGAKPITFLLIVVIAVFIASLGGLLGMIFNLLFPMMKWDNPNKPAKQGLALFLTMISAFLTTGVFAVALLYLPLSSEPILAIIAAVTVIANAVLYAVILRNCKRLIMKRT